MKILLYCCLLLLGGCAADRLDHLVELLNARGVSNCLEIHGAYLGQSITLYGRAGSLDCVALWTGGRVVLPTVILSPPMEYDE